jgi:hypothetical protein
MELLLGGGALVLRLVPWLGAIFGLVLTIAGETIQPLPGHPHRRLIQAIGIGLTGVCIGALTASF